VRPRPGARCVTATGEITVPPANGPCHGTLLVDRVGIEPVLRGWLPDEVGGVSWFSFDNPAQSPRFPIFSGVLELPKSFEVCGQARYREDAATWWFRRANRLATIQWGRTKPIIEKAVMEFEEKGLSDLPGIEQRVQEMLKKDDVIELRLTEKNKSNERESGEIKIID